jgi:hypothetical protein
MIKNFGIAIAAVLGITAMLSFWSIAANAQLTTSSNVSGINNTTQSTARLAIHPKVTIISPPANSSLPIGVVLVTGNASASPSGSAIKDVKVHVDKQAYSNATPKVTGDWSNWSIKLNISVPGPHVIQARATDIAGNQNWHHVSVNIKSANVNTSSMPASAPTTNATAIVPTTSNKTAVAAPTTNATTTSNKTAVAAPTTNAIVPSSMQHKSIPPSAYPGIIPSTQASTSTPPTNPSPSTAHQCPDGSVADANASCPP